MDRPSVTETRTIWTSTGQQKAYPKGDCNDGDQHKNGRIRWIVTSDRLQTEIVDIQRRVWHFAPQSEGQVATAFEKA